MMIEPATPAVHQELVRLAKTSQYTADFSNRLMFSSDRAYERGWIRFASAHGKIVGFTCVRHKSRPPGHTMLYFIVVDPPLRSLGYGSRLVADLMEQSPSGVVELNVAKNNERAVRFYWAEGFKVVHGEALKGSAWRMERVR